MSNQRPVRLSPWAISEGALDDFYGAPQLKERGWTETMIRDLIGEPDAIRTNQARRSGPPVRLWLRRRVEEVEASTEFARRASRGKRRSESGKEAAVRQDELIRRQVRSVPVRIPEFDDDELTERACAHYNSRSWEFRASPDSDRDFLDRIEVNYLRHERSDYEARLDSLFGQVGRRKAGAVVRNRILDAIADVYPHLDAECDRQRAEEDVLVDERGEALDPPRDGAR